MEHSMRRERRSALLSAPTCADRVAYVACCKQKAITANTLLQIPAITRPGWQPTWAHKEDNSVHRA
eukprot:scaffold74859_cov24-Tisochrysis_lutea.AAC.2